MCTSDTETDFDFYLRFAKPLVLHLDKPDDRALAAAWVQRLRDANVGSHKLRTNYLKLLLFVLQRKKLIGVFSKNPSQVDKLEEFPENNLQNVAKELLKLEDTNRKREVLSGVLDAKGDFPPYTTEHSADLLEYSAAQDIPKFGVHAYYAISNEPLPKWNRPEKAVFSKGNSSSPEKSVTTLERISQANIASFERTTDLKITSENLPKKSKSDHRDISKISQSRLKLRPHSSILKSCSNIVDPNENTHLKNTLLTTETGEAAVDKRESSKNPLPSLIQSKDKNDDNKLTAAEPHVRNITTEALENPEDNPLMLTSQASMFGAESIPSDYTLPLLYPSDPTQQSPRFCRDETDPYLLESRSTSSSSSSKLNIPERSGPALSGGKEYEFDLSDDIANLDDAREGGSGEKQSDNDGVDEFGRMISEHEREDAQRQTDASSRIPTRQTRRRIPVPQQSTRSTRGTVPRPTCSRRQVRAGTSNIEATLRGAKCLAKCFAGQGQPDSSQRPQAPRAVPTVQSSRIPTAGYQRSQPARLRSAIPRSTQIPVAEGTRLPSYQLRYKLYSTASGTRIPIASRTISVTRIPAGPQGIQTGLPRPTERRAISRTAPCYRPRPPLPREEVSPFFLESPPPFFAEASFLSQVSSSPTIPTSDIFSHILPPGEESNFFLESPPSFLNQVGSLPTTPTADDYYYPTSPQRPDSPCQPTGAPCPSSRSPTPTRPQSSPTKESAFALQTDALPCPSLRTPSPTRPSPRYYSPAGVVDPAYLSISGTRTPSPRRPPPRTPSPITPPPRKPPLRKQYPVTHLPPKPSPPGIETATKQLQYDISELQQLGLKLSDLDDAIFNLEELDNLDISDATLPPEQERELSERYNLLDDAFIDKELEEFEDRIAKLEAEHAEDMALFGSPSPPKRVVHPRSPKKKSVRTAPPVAVTPGMAIAELSNACRPCETDSGTGKQKVIATSKTKIITTNIKPEITKKKTIETTKKIEKETTGADDYTCLVTTTRLPDEIVMPPTDPRERHQPIDLYGKFSDSFEECERICGIAQSLGGKLAATTKEVEESIRVAQSAAKEQYKQLLKYSQLADRYERYKQRYKHRRPDVPRTPPIFSRYAEVMGPEAERVYHPSEFGAPEDEEWVPAETFMEGRTQLSPREERPMKQLLPGISRELAAEQFFEAEVAPEYLEELDKQIEDLAATEEALRKETEKIKKSSPPRTPPSPALPGYDFIDQQEPLHFESPPQGYYGSPVGSPMSPEEAQALPDAYDLPRRVVPSSSTQNEKLTKMRMKADLREIQARAERQLQMLDSPQLTKQEEEDINVYVAPERRKMLRRVARMVSDIPDTFEPRHQYREWNLPLTTQEIGVLEEPSPIFATSPIASPIRSPSYRSRSATPQRSVTPSRPVSPEPPHYSPDRSLEEFEAAEREFVSGTSPKTKVPPPKRVVIDQLMKSAAQASKQLKELQSPKRDLFKIDQRLDFDEEIPPEEFYYLSPPRVEPTVKAPSPERPRKAPSCIICKLHEAGEPAYIEDVQGAASQGVCNEHMALLQPPAKRWHPPRRRIKIAKPRMEPVYESPLKVPRITHVDTRQFENLPVLPLPVNLFGTSTPIYDQSPQRRHILDQSPPRQLPSPTKPIAELPGWRTPPRFETSTKPALAKLPGPSEPFVLSRPVPKQDIFEEEIPDEFVVYSPPQLSPGRQIQVPQSLSPLLEHGAVPYLEEEQQPGALYRSPIAKTPPPGPESPVESPFSLRVRLLQGEFPPYYSQEEMLVPKGGTRSKRQLIKRKSAPPPLHKLREFPQDFHEEHLPFLSQVEASRPFQRARKRMRIATPQMPTVEETPKKIKTITSRRKVGVDKSDPNNPVFTEVIETEETVEADERYEPADVENILKNLDRRYVDLPELPQTELPENLFGVAGPGPDHRQTSILDRQIHDQLPSPIAPLAKVPGWSSPARLRKPAQPPPQYEFKLHPNLRDILFYEGPPVEMLSPITSSPAPYSSPPRPCPSPSRPGSPPPLPCATPPAISRSPQPQSVPIQSPTLASSPHQDIFEAKPRFVALEMPPEDFMPAGSPPSPQAVVRQEVQLGSPDTTVDSFEAHERSAEGSPTSVRPPDASPVVSHPQPATSSPSELRKLQEKIEQQFRQLESPEKRDVSPQVLMELEHLEKMIEAVATGSPQVCPRSPERPPCGEQYSPNISLVDFEEIERSLFAESAPTKTRVPTPPRAIIGQMIDTGAQARRQHAELQKSPTWLDHVQHKIRDVPEPYLPRRMPAVALQKRVASPQWSPKLSEWPTFGEQIDQEIVPEDVWGSPKAPQSPKLPCSPNIPCSPRSPRPDGSPKTDIFEVEPLSPDYLDTILPEIQGSPEQGMPSPPCLDDFFKVHSPVQASPGSPVGLIEAIKEHKLTPHYYDRSKRLLTPYVQVKSKRIPVVRKREPQFSPITESLIEDSPVLQRSGPTTEVVEEVIEEIIEDFDEAEGELELAGYKTPPRLARPRFPPPQYYYVPGPQYELARQSPQYELARQSPPMLYGSPELAPSPDIFEEAQASPVPDVTPPRGLTFSPSPLSPSPEESPLSPYLGFSPPGILDQHIYEPSSAPYSSPVLGFSPRGIVGPSPYSSPGPSPGFIQSVRQHETSFSRPPVRGLPRPPLTKIKEQRFEFPELSASYLGRGPRIPTKPVGRETPRALPILATRASPPRQQQPSTGYELPQAIYYGSPGRDFIRTPVTRTRAAAEAELKGVNVVDKTEVWDDDSPYGYACTSTRLPFEGQTSPYLLDTSLIGSDLDASFVEDDMADFKWIG